MKKLLLVFLSVAMIAALFCVSVSADALDDLIAYAHSLDTENQVPDDIYAAVENVLRQIPVSDEQVAQIKPIIDNIKANVAYKGRSAHEYTREEVKFVLEEVEKVNDILKVKMETNLLANGEHKGDYEFIFYYNNRNLGVLDFDAVKETGSSYMNAALIGAASVCVLAAAAFVTVAMSKKIKEN